MPNLDLSSLQRLLALEEAALQYPAMVTASSSDSATDTVPIMESLRSPTTRNMMFILQHRSAHGFISGRLEAAHAEQAQLEEVALSADTLLREPLKKSFSETVSTMLQEVHVDLNSGSNKMHRRSCDHRHYMESDVSGSSEPLGYTEQPNHSRAVVFGPSVDDDDVRAASRICFVLPKNDAGTVIPMLDAPSSVLAAAADTSRPSGHSSSSETSRVHSTTLTDYCDRDAIEEPQAVLLIPCDARRRYDEERASARTAAPDADSMAALNSRARLQALLVEQKEQDASRREQKKSYDALLDGLKRWQKTRAEALDTVLNAPVPSRSY